MAGDDVLKTGEIAPQQIRAGIVVLSYVVSVLGSLTTLELLNRRTAGRGKLNWFLLGASSVSMGAIAIWSMHFIGNQAITLAHGNPKFQLMYSPVFTAISFFLPILVLSVAFFFAGANEEEDVSKFKVGLGGGLAGLAICAMHYAGQFGVANYSSEYKLGHVIGSVVIAVVASISALVLFFIFRSRWEGSFWKRVLCAFVLGAAVSGMHWLAATGTSYRLRTWNTSTHMLSREQLVIIVMAFSIAACAFLIGFAIYIGTRYRKTVRTSQKIVLLSVVFDNDGRLLVTTDGVIPSETIVDCEQSKAFTTFEYEFSRVHPVFQWIYRTSRYWDGVKEQIETMQQHLQITKSHKVGANIGLLFREMFCVAAYNLSQRLRLPLDQFGVLYEQIVSTGQVTGLTNAPSTVKKRSVKRSGKGHTLIICRKANKQQTIDLQAAGFRFGSVNLVIDTVAKPLQVNPEQLRTHLDRIYTQVSAKEENILDPGIHIGCFATQKHVDGNLDIIVHSDAKDLIPTFQMPIPSLPRKHQKYLSRYESLTMTEIIQQLRNQSFLHDRNQETPKNDPDEEAFLVHFQMTLQGMVQKYKDRFIQESRLVAVTFDVPCRRISAMPAAMQSAPSTSAGDEKEEFRQLQEKPTTAKMIVFRSELPANSKGWIVSNFKQEPLKFFYTRQRCFSTAPDHAVLARQSQEEFQEALEAATSGDGGSKWSFANLLSSKRRGAQRLPSRRRANSDTPSDSDDGKDISGDDAEMGRLRNETSTWAEKVFSFTAHSLV